jgi:hypothetical protein
MIGWVLGHEKNPSHIHIGIAHGNVSGLGLDHHDQYFNMTPAELAHCNLDFWLLGHIHVPFPQQEQVSQNPGIFMAGTHMPDSWKYKHAGNAWHIEIDENKKLQAKRVKPTEIRIDEITQIVNNGLELEALGRLLNNDYKIEKTALRLNLNGRADIEIQQALNKLLADLEPQFLELKVQNNVTRKIDAQLINTTFPNNSLPHVLLSELLEENPTGDSVELAFQILEKVTKEK